MAVRDGRKEPVANFYVAKVDPNRLRPLRRQIGLIDEIIQPKPAAGVLPVVP